MKRTTLDDDDRPGPRSGPGRSPVERAPLSVVSMQPQTPGMEVQEAELGMVTAQQVYRMRCECGRSWFELELLRLAECPACHRLGLVSKS